MFGNVNLVVSGFAFYFHFRGCSIQISRKIKTVHDSLEM